MDGRLIVEAGSIYDLVSLVKRNGLRRLRAPHVALTALYRMARARIAARRHAGERQAERGAPLRSRRRPLRALPRRRPPIFLRLFRDAGAEPRGRAAREEAAHRREAAARARPACARHRLRLGRPRALSRRSGRRPRHRHHALGEAARDRPAARAEEQGLDERVAFRLEDYRRIEGHVRPHRLGRHVRACRPRGTTRPSSRRPRRC